jgi:membrane protein YqaA with SNARE-associated domain
MFEFSEATGFLGLFASSFLSATLLPGGSEVVLIAMIHRFPDAVWHAVGLATLGNTLGGMTSYLVGRLLPNRIDQRTVAQLRRYGYWTLLFSWLPVVGDAFCVGAGWLRFNAWLSALLLALGKLARYLLIAGGWVWIESLFKT